MTFDHDAIEPEENTAIGFSRVHLLAQRSERLPREQVAKSRGQRPVHGQAQVRCKLMCGALCRLERDVAREPFRHDNIDRTFADVISLDEAMIVEVRELPLAQDAPSLPHLL